MPSTTVRIGLIGAGGIAGAHVAGYLRNPGTVTFADGMTVTIQSAGLKPASAYASGAVEGKIAVVQITVTNEGEEVVDAAGVSALTASAGEAGGRQGVTDVVAALLGVRL